MRKSANITKEHCNHYSGYTWSNEWYVMYRDLFNEIKKGKGKINHLLSVGGGDHILFALVHLGSITRLTHVDISSYSIAGALAKFAVILEGTFEDWYAFSFNSLPVSFVNQCLDNRGFTPIMKKLSTHLSEGRGKATYAERMPSDLFYGLVHSDGEPLRINRKELFLQRHYYDIIKRRLAKIIRYDLFIHDIWTLKLDDQPDMALLSNAYHNDNQPNPNDDFLVRKGGLVIYTECDGGSWFKNAQSWEMLSKATQSGSWEGKLYKRTA